MSIRLLRIWDPSASHSGISVPGPMYRGLNPPLICPDYINTSFLVIIVEIICSNPKNRCMSQCVHTYYMQNSITQNDVNTTHDKMGSKIFLKQL